MSYTIKKEDKISDVLIKYPKAAELLLGYGLTCVGCIFNQFDTVESGAKLHGLADKEVDQMVIEINRELNKDEK